MDFENETFELPKGQDVYLSGTVTQRLIVELWEQIFQYKRDNLIRTPVGYLMLNENEDVLDNVKIFRILLSSVSGNIEWNNKPLYDITDIHIRGIVELAFLYDKKQELFRIVSIVTKFPTSAINENFPTRKVDINQVRQLLLSVDYEFVLGDGVFNETIDSVLKLMSRKKARHRQPKTNLVEMFLKKTFYANDIYNKSKNKMSSELDMVFDLFRGLIGEDQLDSVNKELRVKLLAYYPIVDKLDDIQLSIFARLVFLKSYWIPYNKLIVQIKKDRKINEKIIEKDESFLTSLNIRIDSLLAGPDKISVDLITGEDDNKPIALFMSVKTGPVTANRSGKVNTILRIIGKATTETQKAHVSMVPFWNNVLDPLVGLTIDDFQIRASGHPIPPEATLDVIDVNLAQKIEELRKSPLNLKKNIPVTPVTPVVTPAVSAPPSSVPTSITEDIIVPIMGDEVLELEGSWGSLKDEKKQDEKNKRLKMMVEKFITEKAGVQREIDEAAKNGVFYDPMNRTIENPSLLTKDINDLIKSP
jgi:hypothetical protein